MPIERTSTREKKKKMSIGEYLIGWARAFFFSRSLHENRCVFLFSRKSSQILCHTNIFVFGAIFVQDEFCCVFFSCGAQLHIATHTQSLCFLKHLRLAATLALSFRSFSRAALFYLLHSSYLIKTCLPLLIHILSSTTALCVPCWSVWCWCVLAAAKCSAFIACFMHANIIIVSRVFF